MNPASPQAQPRLNPTAMAVAGWCALMGFGVWQFWGNAVRGYIDTASVFWWWGWQWFNPDSESQHGPVILALAGWVFWRNLKGARGEGRGAALTGTIWPAVGAMVVGLGIHLLGYAVQQTRISIVALLLFSWGVLRLAGGERWGRAAIFPLSLLVFAIPMGALDAVGFHLRVVVIATTEVLAHAAGIDVVRNGTQLFAPDGSYQYDVAAACSGVRSLMALLALSALVGYLGLRSNWRRGAVFLLALPLTVVGNVVRISAVVFAGEWIGQRAGELVHDWAGFVVFLIVLGGVQAAVQWLAQRELPGVAAAVGAPRRGELYPWSARRAVGVAGGMLVATLLVGVGVRKLDGLSLRGVAGVPLAADGVNPAALPVFLGTDWIGQTAEVSEVERELLPADTGYARMTYVSLDDRRRQVFVSVVLSGQDRTSIHRPELCLVGQGWTILDHAETTYAVGEAGQLPAATLRLRREVVDAQGRIGEVPGVFSYWFVGRDQIETSTVGRLWQTAVNRLRLKPDRWAYVVVQTTVLPGETEDAAQGRMNAVVEALWPQLTPASFKIAAEKD